LLAKFTATGFNCDVGILLPANGEVSGLALDWHALEATVVKSPPSMEAFGMNVVVSGGFERLRVP
jgi:hypothetical protein